jgi:hypothetical protein
MIGTCHYLIWWCRRRDLNPHGGEPHRILSPARLPFHHSGTIGKPLISNIFGSTSRDLGIVSV